MAKVIRKSSGSGKTRKKGKSKASDERFVKVVGAVCLLFSLYLIVAFTSYLFTWRADQDKVLQFSWQLLGQSELTVENWLGRLGAIVSNAFFYWGFGVASFGCVAIVGKLGWTMLSRQPMAGFITFTRKALLMIVFSSLTLEFLLMRFAFPWGGAFGESTYIWLSSFIGDAGLFLFLVFAIAVNLIWVFNPSIATPAALEKLNLSPNWARFFALFKSSKPVKAFAGIESVDEDEEEDSDTLQPTFYTSFKKSKPEPEEDEEEEDEEEETDDLEFELQAEHPRSKRTTGRAELEIAEPEANTSYEEEMADEGPSSLVTPPNMNPDPLVTYVEEDNIDHSEPYDPTKDLSDYKYPDMELLLEYAEENVEIDRAELEANKDQIIGTLLNYKIEITKIRATIGPTVTLYEIVPAAGVRISRIKNLEDDIALSLAALGIRIIAPIPGKGTIGIEVPNKKKQVVSLKEVLQSDKYQHAKMDLPIVLGKTIANEVFVADLAKMPHLLVAGATGQGKSVGINTILMSLLYKKHPSQLKFVLIDPKKVELFPYAKLEKHFLAILPGQDEPIVTETKKVIHTLNSLCIEMDDRYNLLKKAHARNLREYNDKFVNRKLNPNNGHKFMPFIVLIIDEFADLIMTAGKEIELPIGRLAQLARAVGIHLIIATQRPSVNIITGVIKANFPARLAYKVASKVDSRTILDQGGAEQLIGRGDMLLSIGSSVIRLQCAFVDTPEVEFVIDAIADQRGYPEPYYLPEYQDEDTMIEGAKGLKFSDLDEMFEDAARVIVKNQLASTSKIQRRLKLGYNRAGRIMDQLEAVGIVGPNEGSKPRHVLVYNEMELDTFLEDLRAVS
jgi:S-DNA-T family DNA segregation ATPase FtsK/SpoIIIE